MECCRQILLADNGTILQGSLTTEWKQDYLCIFYIINHNLIWEGKKSIMTLKKSIQILKTKPKEVQFSEAGDIHPVLFIYF